MAQLKKILTLFFLFFLLPAWSEVFWIQDYDVYFDPLEDWILLEGATPEGLSLTNTTYQVYFQSIIQDPSGTLEERIQDLEKKLSVSESEWITWNWEGRTLALGDFIFPSPQGSQRAYALLVPLKEKNLTFLGFTREEYFNSYNDDLLSVINSLALGEETRRNPGPLSAYMRELAFSQDSLDYQWSFENKSQTHSFLPQALENQEITIEREARIMQRYEKTEYLQDAWSRYYRIIFREGYQDLAPIADFWKQVPQLGLASPEELPQLILTYLQGYEYSRRGGLSDLYPVTTSLVEKKGDCDSLALIYASILDHLGYDVILMVSQQYAHAMVGVDLPGEGARFNHNERAYMVAELTAPVDLGMIDSTMADSSHWFGLELWGNH